MIKISLKALRQKRCELFESHWEYGFFVVVGCEFGICWVNVSLVLLRERFNGIISRLQKGTFFFFSLWHFHKHPAHTVIIFNSSPSLLLFLLLSLSRSRSPLPLPLPLPHFFFTILSFLASEFLHLPHIFHPQLLGFSLLP